MKFSELPDLWKTWTPMVVGIGGLLLAFGWAWQSPNARITKVEGTVDTLQTRSDVTLELLSDMVRGECLESCADKLMLQGLMAKCKALGVERNVGDEIDARVGCDG